MGHPERSWTYDDELHQRRRKLAPVRQPVDFSAWRLKKLQEQMKDTRDP